MPDDIEPVQPASPPSLPRSRGPAADLARMEAQMNAGRLARPGDADQVARRAVSDNGRTRALRALAYERPDLGLNTETRVGDYDWDEHDRLDAGGAAADARAAAERERAEREAADLDLARGRHGNVIDVEPHEDDDVIDVTPRELPEG